MIKEGKFLKLSDLLPEALHNHMGESGKPRNSTEWTAGQWRAMLVDFMRQISESSMKVYRAGWSELSDIRESVYHHSNPYHLEEGNAFHSLRMLEQKC